jgi:hypothetical protein
MPSNEIGVEKKNQKIKKKELHHGFSIADRKEKD